ncbi:MAG: cohesin domain-containing protein [Clostridia bacterium]
MKKKLVLISMVFMLLLSVSIASFAAEGNLTATLTATADKQNLKAGEEVLITLSLKNISNLTGNGITNITTTIKYDTNIFEEITDGDITSSLLKIYNDNDSTHELSFTTSNGIKEDTELAIIKFKVKESVSNTSTTIKFTNTNVSESGGSLVQISDSEVPLQIGLSNIPEAKLTKIEITKKPTKIAYKIGEKFDPTGMEVTATYDDGKTVKVTDYTYAPITELKETDTVVTITYKEGTITKTAEQKITVNESGTLPQTGITTNIALIIVVATIAVLSLAGIRKYRNI